MSSFVSKYVVCPFYSRHNDNRICCEGLSENNTINLVFEDSKQQKHYVNDNCERIDHYKQCPIFRMIVECKYKEDANNI